MKFEKGQDVVVDFRGVEHPGVVLRHSRGQVLCRIAIDPEMDYGDFDQLKILIDYYLANDAEREQIRVAGHEHVVDHHTYRQRWAAIIKTVFA